MKDEQVDGFATHFTPLRSMRVVSMLIDVGKIKVEKKNVRAKNK